MSPRLGRELGYKGRFGGVYANRNGRIIQITQVETLVRMSKDCLVKYVYIPIKYRPQGRKYVDRPRRRWQD